MRRLQASRWLSLVALASCTPQTLRVDVGALLATTNGKIALQNAGGSLVLADEMNDLDDQLGLGDTEASPYVRLQWEHELHRVRAHGFGIDADGEGILAGDYGGIPAGSAVTTSMQLLAASAAYSYEVWGNEHFRLALGGELGVYSLDIAARSGSGREQVETDLVIPMPFAEVEVFFGPVTLGANLGAMAADLRDADGRYVDAEAFGRFQVTNEIDLIAGYRYLMMDAVGTATSRDFDADIDVRGFFFGGGIRF
ncbi:MAG: hypothetical protein Q7T30_01890 [Planctomycetota bacterium]|nr:hypothetical protein [Planctomycetota bacterium]